MKMKLLSRNTFDPERPLAKFPRIHRGISEIAIKMVKFRMPSRELAKKYEAKKKEYMESKFREFQEQLDLMDGGQISMKNGKPAVPLQCDECGYEWEYTGLRKNARCPSCDHRVYVAEMEEDTGIKVKCRHCGYPWTYTGGAKHTACPNCEGYVNTGKDIVEVKREIDPMNAPIRPGMTREEIVDIMTEKLIRQGKTMDKSTLELIEKLAELAARKLEEKGGKEGEKNDHDEGK